MAVLICPNNSILNALIGCADCVACRLRDASTSDLSTQWLIIPADLLALLVIVLLAQGRLLTSSHQTALEHSHCSTEPSTGFLQK